MNLTNHIVKCLICGEKYDRRDLNKVFFHATEDEYGRHVPTPVLNFGRGVQVGPCSRCVHFQQCSAVGVLGDDTCKHHPPKFEECTDKDVKSG